MFFELKDAKKIERSGFTAFLYNDKSDIPEYSCVYVVVRGSHEKEIVKKSHRLYFVIEGTGSFVVGPEKYEVKINDVVVIPPKVPYSYSGKMLLFEVNFPATNSTDVVKVK